MEPRERAKGNCGLGLRRLGAVNHGHSSFLAHFVGVRRPVRCVRARDCAPTRARACCYVSVARVSLCACAPLRACACARGSAGWGGGWLSAAARTNGEIWDTLLGLPAGSRRGLGSNLGSPGVRREFLTPPRSCLEDAAPFGVRMVTENLEAHEPWNPLPKYK